MFALEEIKRMNVDKARESVAEHRVRGWQDLANKVYESIRNVSFSGGTKLLNPLDRDVVKKDVTPEQAAKVYADLRQAGYVVTEERPSLSDYVNVTVSWEDTPDAQQ